MTYDLINIELIDINERVRSHPRRTRRTLARQPHTLSAARLVCYRRRRHAAAAVTHPITISAAAEPAGRRSTSPAGWGTRAP